MRRKKRLCQTQNWSHDVRPVAISVLSTRVECFGKFLHRGSARTDSKCNIMVKAIPTIKKEVTDPDEELPDFENPAEDIKEAWRFEPLEDIEERVGTNLRKRGIHAVDPIAVTLKMQPTPFKDLPLNWLEAKTEGWYGGHNIVETLSDDKFVTVIDGNKVKVSRWALLDIPENLSDRPDLVTAQNKARGESHHGQATIKAPMETKVPYDFEVREDGTQKPIIGIRVFHGGPSQAMNEIVYQSFHGFLHVNLAQDGELKEGVYCWNDIKKAIASFQEDCVSYPIC